MQLSTKPDLERAKSVWRHFWNQELMRRPPVVASVERPDAPPAREWPSRYFLALTGRWEELEAHIEDWLARTVFLAESVPSFQPDLGPDQFAAFLGGAMHFSEDSPGTNWIEPWVDDWGAAFPIELQIDSPAWQGVLALSRRMAKHGRGRYLVGVCDLHSNMDTLLAMRGGERLSMDFYDAPDALDRAMQEVRKLYRPVYEALYEAGGMGRATGSMGWIPFWSDGRFATIQCDYICMISPAMARRYVIPALEEEAAFLDHCVYHLDGPGALPHLDDILAIKGIDCIQWVSGAGQPPMHTWTEVLQKCQRAGKSLDVYGLGLEELKTVHPLLEPNKVAYHVSVLDEAECDELLKWLENNS